MTTDTKERHEMHDFYSIEDEDGEVLILDEDAVEHGLVYLHAIEITEFGPDNEVIVGPLPVTAIIEGLKEVTDRDAMEDALIENGLGLAHRVIARNRNVLISQINDLETIIRNKNVQIAQLESDVRELDAEVKSLDAVIDDLTEQINLVAEEDEPRLTAEDYAKASLARHPKFGLMVRESCLVDDGYMWGNPDYIASDKDMAKAGATIITVPDLEWFD